MFEGERERGIGLARLPREERDELVTRLMFGRHWLRAREAMLMLMHAWGIATPDVPGPPERSDRE
jgi:hypothetical protein